MSNPCIFCRSSHHSKYNCDNPNTRAKEQQVIQRINSIYFACLRNNLTLAEFISSCNIIFSAKNTVLELKMAIEYLKKRTEERFIGENNKRGFVEILCKMSSVVFIYRFNTSPQPVNILNPHELTIGIHRVTREILNPNLVAAESRFNTAPVTPPTLATAANRFAGQSPTNNSFSAHLNNTFQRRHMPTHIAPPPPQLEFNIHKTDKKCNEEDECAICYNTLSNETYVYINCLHEFCKTCLKNCLSRKLITCPMCRANITDVYTQNPIVKYSL